MSTTEVTKSESVTEAAPPEKEKAQKTGHTKVHHGDDKVVKAQKEALEFALKDIIVNKDQNVRTGALPDNTSLVESIKREGVLEPLIGAPAFDAEGNILEGKVELIAGYRRYDAAKEAGLKSVPVRLITADAGRRHRVALIENLQRADMNAMDQARGIQKLMEDEGVDQKGAAEMLGFTPGYVSQRLSLLKLPKKAQHRVENGKLEWTNARELTRITDPETIENLLDEAQTMTASELKNRVEVIISKERAKEEESGKKRAGKGSKNKVDAKSVEDLIHELEYAPLKKNDWQERVQEYTLKLKKTEDETKQAEYRAVLRGLFLAGGYDKMPRL